MATPVPYNPVPTVAPGLEPIPRPSLDTPLSAFGGLVAQATEHLGQVSDQVGNELWSRAMAMQQLNQEAAANEASARYAQGALDKFLKFQTLTGKDAVDAYPQYNKDLESLREETGRGLSPYASVMYNNQTRNEQFRMQFSAGWHANQQNRQYAIDSFKASNDIMARSAEATPEDLGNFERNIDVIRSGFKNNGALFPGGDAQAQDEMGKEVSRQWTARLKGMAKTQPFEAEKEANEAIKRGDLSGDDAANVLALIQSHQNSVGARNIASQVMSGADLRFGNQIVAPAMARAAIRGNESSGRYSIIGPPDGKGGVPLGAYGVMSYNLGPWLREAGMPQQTQAEFLADHAAQDQLFDFKFGQYQEKYGSFNAAAKAWFTGTATPGPGARDSLGTTVPAYLAKANATLARIMPVGTLQDAGRALASERAPNNPNLPDIVADRITAEKGREVQTQRQAEFDNKDIVNKAIGQNGPNGKLPVTIEDLPPDAQDAFYRMGGTDQRSILSVLAANAKGDYAISPEALRQYQRFRGIATDPNAAPSDRDALMSADILNMKIPWTMRNQLLNDRRALVKEAISDPRTGQAMSVLDSQLRDVGITRTDDPDSYYEFRGMLQDELRDWTAINDRPPREEEVKQIGSRMLQKQGTDGWFRAPLAFQMQVPSEQFDDIARLVHQEKPDATVEEIRRAWVRQQFQIEFQKNERSIQNR